jgi:hypothetical protein
MNKSAKLALTVMSASIADYELLRKEVLEAFIANVIPVSIDDVIDPASSMANVPDTERDKWDLMCVIRLNSVS